MKSLRFLLVTSIILLPLLTIAAGEPTSGTVKYAPLIEITGLTDATGGGSFSAYVDFLYGLSIAIAALLAVIKIVVAGVKYMMSSLPGTKGSAKGEIQGALLGLLLILGAYLILNTINPALTKTTVNFQSLKENPKYANRPPALKPATAAPAGTQAANTGVTQFDTGFPSCAPIRSSTSGTFDTRVVNTTTCTTEDRQKAILRFNSLCSSLGGTQNNGGDSNTQTSGCAIPKAASTATPVVQQSVLDQAYKCTVDDGIKTQGTVRYHYYNLSSCPNATVLAAAKEVLLNSSCKPNPLLNLGSDKHYCKI